MTPDDPLFDFFRDGYRLSEQFCTDFFGDEFRLIERITAKNLSPNERQRLIAELEALPVRKYQFHHRWMLINEVSPFEAWDAEGFHPNRSRWPRDVQLLWAATYGKL